MDIDSLLQIAGTIKKPEKSEKPENYDEIYLDEDSEGEKKKEKKKKKLSIIEIFKKQETREKEFRKKSALYSLSKSDLETVKESPKNYEYCLKYYYPDPKDFANVEDGGLNLSCKPRPWYTYEKEIIENECFNCQDDDDSENCSVCKGSFKKKVHKFNVSGRKAFSDATVYKPKDMDKYVQNHFLKPFDKIKRESPFKYQKDFIDISSDDLIKTKGFELKPHQKFCGQFINNHTDFPGLLVYHRLGSGKTITSVIIAESMKATSITPEGTQDIPGRQTRTLKKNSPKGCTVTIAVPKSIIQQYKREIAGEIENGVIKSATGACVIYAEDDSDDDSENPEKKYMGYRQYYTGTVARDRNGKLIYDKNGEVVYEMPVLNSLQDLEGKIKILKEKIDKNDFELQELDEKSQGSESESLKKKKHSLIEKINKRKSDLKRLKDDLKKGSRELDQKIYEVYFIVSQNTLFKRLSQVDLSVSTKKVDEKGHSIDTYKFYNASEYVLGREEWKSNKNDEETFIGTPPHPDCFHSQKSLLIIDEIQKNVAVDDSGVMGSYHSQLYHMLNYNARELRTGLPAMKIVLLTATPVFDVPHQMAMMVNLIRPRIPFPTNKTSFRKMFIEREKDGEVLKNKLLLSYMMSGYVSYCAGGNPNGYPYRRNHIITHTMKQYQYSQYSDFLTFDIRKIAKDRASNKKSSSSASFTDKIMLGIKESGGGGGKFQRTRGAAISALPDINVSGSSSYSKVKRSSDYEAVLKLDEILQKNPKDFEMYSSKLKWIGDKIKESSKTDEGPIFVYSSLIARGLLPLASYLEASGYSILTDHDVISKTPKELYEIFKKNKNGKKMFAVWGGEAFSHYKNSRKLFKDQKKEGIYKEKLRELFNHQLNKDGFICKVILGRIEEGVSFKSVSQVHLCDPWWNQSKMEQIIGRGIRYLSHALMKENERFVDVYYHCSVLASYPDIDKDLLKKFPREENYMDMARSSVEQNIFSTARRKNNLNNQFDLVAKETAVDCELNYYGNVNKLEEFEFPKNNSINVPDGSVVMYNRLLNKYYLFSKKEKVLTEIEMIYQEPEFVSFPPMSFDINNDKVVKPFKLDTKKDSQNRSMISIMVLEDIESFNKNPKVNDKNFHELMEYAIKKGEEKEAWEFADKLRLNNEAIEMLIATFGLETARGTKQLQDCLVNNFLDGPIKGVSPKDLSKAREDKLHLENLIMTKEAKVEKRFLIDNLLSTRYKKLGYDALNEYSIYQLRNMWSLLDVPTDKKVKKPYKKQIKK